jgi:hypothetical protein
VKPPPEERIARPRKSTRLWCRGKVGREHETALVFDRRRYGGFWGIDCRPYGFKRADGSPIWHCLHIEVCTDCGKITQHNPLCPDLPEGYQQRG